MQANHVMPSEAPTYVFHVLQYGKFASGVKRFVVFFVCFLLQSIIMYGYIRAVYRDCVDNK